jgi:hypothetical protein
LIKVDFDWNFALNKYSLRAYLQSFPQPTILNDNVNQFKVGLESDKCYFTKKVGHQISVSFEKFDVVQALLSFF